MRSFARELPQRALTVIVPRHPQRFAAVADLLRRRGKPFVLRSSNAPVTADVEVVLGDSMGEMAGYYAAADIAFVGGSLLPLGGQNLIEPIGAGRPTLIGPHMFNFADAAREGAGSRCRDRSRGCRCARRNRRGAHRRRAAPGGDAHRRAGVPRRAPRSSGPARGVARAAPRRGHRRDSNPAAAERQPFNCRLRSSTS